LATHYIHNEQRLRPMCSDTPHSNAVWRSAWVYRHLSCHLYAYVISDTECMYIGPNIRLRLSLYATPTWHITPGRMTIIDLMFRLSGHETVANRTHSLFKVYNPICSLCGYGSPLEMGRQTRKRAEIVVAEQLPNCSSFL